MSLSTPASGNQVQQWLRQFHAEYIRENPFFAYMGTNENAIIQAVEDLTTKAGYKVSIPLVTRLKGTGVRGSSALEGAEEALSNYNHDLAVHYIRNAVAVHRADQQKSEIDLLQGAKPMLKNWIRSLMRDDIITALMAPAAGKALLASQVLANSNYSALASEAEKDAWLAANSDRVLFGAAKSNNAANDHSAALAQIDNTNDKLTPDMVSLAKRMAKVADPHIRPYMTKEGEEWFVMFCQSYAYRDLKTHATITAANRDGWTRYNGGTNGGTNPLFRDGDLIWDGVIIREVPEIPIVSNGTIDCAPNFLCGAQAVGVAWAQKTTNISETRDYGAIKGVGVEEYRGIEKLMFNGVQQGVVTVYSAGVADS